MIESVTHQRRVCREQDERDRAVAALFCFGVWDVLGQMDERMVCDANGRYSTIAPVNLSREAPIMSRLRLAAAAAAVFRIVGTETLKARAASFCGETTEAWRQRRT